MEWRIMNKISSMIKIPFNNFDCTNSPHVIHLWSRLPISDGKKFKQLEEYVIHVNIFSSSSYDICYLI